MGRKAVGHVCCVTHAKEPSARLISKREGIRPDVTGWIGRLQHIAPQHLVNHNIVLCKRSRPRNSNMVPQIPCIYMLKRLGRH